MSLHEQNKAKIKAGTFVEVLSLEHLALISKYMVELGFYFYAESFYRAKDGTQPFLHFNDDFQVSSGVDADDEFKEVKIEMPEETTPNERGEYLKQIGEDIHARILAEKVSASDVLSQGAKHLSDRAATYDSPEGERSMGATVEAFESITGHALTEEQGWLFMVLLKAVRSQQGDFKQDNYEDGAAYFALACESASEARK